MNDPYAVLGVSSSASEEEIKRAYRDLVKKYHPDNYANNPLADLAEAKMKEVNEAYDAIMKARTQGGYQSARRERVWRWPDLQPGRRPLQQSHADSGAPAHCPEQSGGGGTDSPEYPGQQRGVVLPYGQYRLPPGLDGRCPARISGPPANMDPNNMEYRQAMNSMGMQARRGTYGGGDDIANLCTTLCCLNCLCNSCSG